MFREIRFLSLIKQQYNVIRTMQFLFIQVKME